MSLTTRILTPISLPEKVQVEIKDTVRNTTAITPQSVVRQDDGIRAQGQST
jgi:hypothetical protein